jgi:hypothetical protein
MRGGWGTRKASRGMGVFIDQILVGVLGGDHPFQHFGFGVMGAPTERTAALGVRELVA